MVKSKKIRRKNSNKPGKALVAKGRLPDFEKRFLSLERALEERFSILESKLAHLNPGFRIHDTPNATKIEASIPGAKKSDFSIQVTDHSVAISAQGKGVAFYKSVSLPFVVIPEKAKADFKGGRLLLTLPKYKEKVPSRTIKA